MRPSRSSAFAPSSLVLCSANLLIVASLGLSGCSSSIAPSAVANSQVISGNWQVSSSAQAASKLPSLSGTLTGSTSAVTGTLHSVSTNSCVAPTTLIQVSGHADAKNNLTLTGTVGGGTLTITGALAGDGKSLTGAAYTVASGSCAFTAQAAATAQSYSSVTGTYEGSFSDANGQVISITANLVQTPASDSDGNFQLSGTGSFPNNQCFSSPVSISNSQVTGGTFTQTYSDPNTQNSVTATGTFSIDATTLTVTNWTLTGSCGPDSGTGSLTRQ